MEHSIRQLCRLTGYYNNTHIKSKKDITANKLSKNSETSHTCFSVWIRPKQIALLSQIRTFSVTSLRGLNQPQKLKNRFKKYKNNLTFSLTKPFVRLFWWCGWWDLNPHVLADTGTWSQLVCQFQHTRVLEFQIFYSAEISQEILARLILRAKIRSNQNKTLSWRNPNIACLPIPPHLRIKIQKTPTEHIILYHNLFGLSSTFL